MRLFVALQIPAKVRAALGELMNELRQKAGASARNAPKWVRAENLHVTLKFIGEIPPARSDEARAVLSQVKLSQPVTLDFRGLGFFPDDKRLRVLWVGVNASPNLQMLASNIEQSLEKMEIPLAQRPFAPHLTLARFEPAGVTDELRAGIQKNATRRFGSCSASEFHLVESKLKPSGAEYTTVQSFRFILVEA